MSAEKIVAPVADFPKSGAQPSTIMGQIAKGYSDEQIKLVAGYRRAAGQEVRRPDRTQSLPLSSRAPALRRREILGAGTALGALAGRLRKRAVRPVDRQGRRRRRRLRRRDGGALPAPLAATSTSRSSSATPSSSRARSPTS